MSNPQKLKANVGYLDIEIAQGSDTTINIDYKVGGSTLDLSTFTGRLQVRQAYNQPVLLELNTVTGTITTNATSPNIVLVFTSDATSAMTVYTDMIYDLEITSDVDIVTKILRGNFTLVPEVTIFP